MATSLFGPTPAELIMAQQKEAQQMQMLRNQQMAQQGQQFGVFAPLYQAGLKFGDVGAQAVTQSLFPQQADPRLQQATAVQSVLAKYADEDQSDPAVLTKIGKDLMSVAPEAGLRALTLAEQLTKKEEKPITVSPGQRLVTPSGKEVYVAPEKTQPAYRVLSPSEARERGLNPNMQYQEDTATGKLTQIGQSPAVVFNAPLTASENAYSQAVGKDSAERDTKQFNAAESAIENISKLDLILDELKTSDAITGFGADLRKEVDRMRAYFLSERKAGKKVSDTEYLDALLGSDVFPMISSLGIGARGLDTPAEREFLRQVMTGTITMNKETLLRLTEMRRNIAERAIKKFNKRVEDGELNRFFQYRGVEPTPLPVPTRQSPASDEDLLRKYLGR